MNRPPKLPLPSLAEARHLAEFGDLRALEALDLRPGHAIAAEVVANHKPYKPVCPAPTARQSDDRTDAEITAAIKAAITPADRAHAAENETARRLLLKARTCRRKAKIAARRRAVAARAPKPKPALPLRKFNLSLMRFLRDDR